MIEINQKIKPLSINECWQGKRYKTVAYKNYEKILLYTLPKKEVPKPPYMIKFKFGFSNKGSDIDNPVKALLDIMQKRYGFNDKDIFKMEIEKEIVKKGDEYFKVKLENIKGFCS